MKKTIIIGAGLTGLSCAYHLDHEYEILEKEGTIGGLCKSVNVNGFTFDYTGHLLHLHQTYTKNLISRLLRSNISTIERNAQIYRDHQLIPYPFQANLYYLPERIRSECLQGFITRYKNKPHVPLQSFLSWSLLTFGTGITKYFMKPYNEKLWTVSSRTLTADWVAPFVPQPTIQEVKNGAQKPQRKLFGYNISFQYPRYGGIQSLTNALLLHVKPPVLCACSAQIDVQKKLLKTLGGNIYTYDTLVSTQPLPELLKQIFPLPANIERALRLLRWNSVICFNLGFNKKDCNTHFMKGAHWFYFPEKKYIFYRLGVYTHIAPSLSPTDTLSFYIEVSRMPGSQFSELELLNRVLEDIKKAGFIRDTSCLIVKKILIIPYAYVIYDKYRTSALTLINNYLNKNSIFSIGRYGAWKYSFMEESILDGKKTAKSIS